MLKANIGLSRKITRDYNSTGYSVNIEGEILAPTDDHEGVLGRIKELFGLAEEALNVEIDRDQGEDAIGRRDEERSAPPPSRHDAGNGPSPPSQPRRNGQPSVNSQSGDNKITDKQVKYLFMLAKRQRLSNSQLETEVEQIVGRQARVYDLSKKEAGRVIDALTQAPQASNH